MPNGWGPKYAFVYRGDCGGHPAGRSGSGKIRSNRQGSVSGELHQLAVTIDVTFATGTELNQATRTFNYTTYKNYAVVFWAPEKATIIQLDGYLVCGFSFEASCLPFTGKMKGQDQQGRLWEVCTGQFCF